LTSPQLPVFIAELPEGNSIASYLIIIIQLGNIIPIGYVVVRQYMRVPYNWVIVGTLGCGIATAILLGVFWDHTAHLFDSTRRYPRYRKHCTYGLRLRSHHDTHDTHDTRAHTHDTRTHKHTHTQR
jgi:hypothetical protein